MTDGAVPADATVDAPIGACTKTSVAIDWTTSGNCEVWPGITGRLVSMHTTDRAVVVSDGRILSLADIVWSEVSVPLADFVPAAVHADDDDHIYVAGTVGGTSIHVVDCGGEFATDHFIATVIDEPRIADITGRRSDDLYLDADCSVFHWDGTHWNRLAGTQLACQPLPAWGSSLALIGDQGLLWWRGSNSTDGSELRVWDGLAWGAYTRDYAAIGQLRNLPGDYAAAFEARSPALDVSISWFLPDGSEGGEILSWDGPLAGSLAGTGANDIILNRGTLDAWDGSVLTTLDTTGATFDFLSDIWSDGTTVAGFGGGGFQRCRPQWP